MDPRQIIRSGITASAVVHVSFVALAIVFSEVHPFAPVAAENVAVDVVTPDQVPEKAPEPPPETEPVPKPKPPDLDLSMKPTAENAPPKSAPAAAAQPPAAPQQAAAEPQPQPESQPQPQSQKQAALAQPKPSPSPAPAPAATPAQNQPQPQPATQPQASSPPAYTQPQPDISIKYHVLLGLPQQQPAGGFDAVATESTNIGSDPIAEFRRHLKTCSTLPKSIAPTDDVAIKLRVQLTRDGRLAAEPFLVEAKASMKGPLLMQSAIRALQSCQPFAMLPADKYDEWKMLDLSFTPHDFGAS